MITVPFHDNNIVFKEDRPVSKKQKTTNVPNSSTTAAPSKLRIKIHSPFKVQSPSQPDEAVAARRKVTPAPAITARQLDFDPALFEPTAIEKMWRLEDHYKLKQLLGEGAYGKVYEAVRISDGQILALKVIPRYNSTDQALEREIQALLALSTPGHDHVCKLYDHHEDEHNVYLAMEYIVGGGELFEHLVKTGPFSEKDASRFLEEFAQGLAYIHSKGYSHGDLKPENLLMSNDAERPCVKIVDFGFCLPKDPPTKLVFGTVAYLAPEILQNLGVPQTPSPEVDMYAVGVIMYTLLTGTHPFDRTNSASDDSILSAMVTSLHHAYANKIPDYLSEHVFDDRVASLSPSAIDLMRNLLEPCASKRMTSAQLQKHPWIQGRTAAHHAMLHSDTKLRRFWQRRFRAAIMKKFHIGILSNDEKLKAIFYDSMDITGNGRVSFKEFQVAMRDIFGHQQMKDIFESIDLEHNGYLDYEEFASIMKTQFEATDTDHIIQRAETLGVMAMTVAQHGGNMPPKVPKVSTTPSVMESMTAAAANEDATATPAAAVPVSTKHHRRQSSMGVRSEILRQFGRNKLNTSMQDLRLIFLHLDADQSGTVEISELMDFLQEQHNVDADAISEWVSWWLIPLDLHRLMNDGSILIFFTDNYRRMK